ncbi:MAG: type II toxin-antitoxin system HicB family antitoxin [Promethearchaeota archaeon]
MLENSLLDMKDIESVDFMKREFNVIIEQDKDDIYVGTVPELPGCYTQARSLDELQNRIIEAIELYLEVNKEKFNDFNRFIGIQKVKINFEEI